MVYSIFSWRVVYNWDKGWGTVTEWLVLGISVQWGHVLVPGNPGNDGVQGLTFPMSWGPSTAWWSSWPRSVFPGMVPWSWWDLRLSNPGPGRNVQLTLPPGLVASSLDELCKELYLISVFYFLAMTTYWCKTCSCSGEKGWFSWHGWNCATECLPEKLWDHFHLCYHSKLSLSCSLCSVLSVFLLSLGTVLIVALCWQRLSPGIWVLPWLLYICSPLRVSFFGFVVAFCLFFFAWLIDSRYIHHKFTSSQNEELLIVVLRWLKW